MFVRTGGHDIYCGNGEEEKCSPFDLTVFPGPVVPERCEVESSTGEKDYLVKALAGETGKIYLQTKDAFGNNQIGGGKTIIVLFISNTNIEIRYRGNVQDFQNGTYAITYSIPLAGQYTVDIEIEGGSPIFCVGLQNIPWYSRTYNGINPYSPPSTCQNQKPFLSVEHGPFHAPSSTVVNFENKSGLTSATVGIESGFAIEARDKFGNIRLSDGEDNVDVFIVSFDHSSGTTYTTSTAMQAIRYNGCNPDAGYFRLKIGESITDAMPYDVSAESLERIIADTKNPSIVTRVTKTGSTTEGEWVITFLSHFDAWSQSSIDLIENESSCLTSYKFASNGVYPVHYTLWKTGLYELRVLSRNNEPVSSHTVEVSCVHILSIGQVTNCFCLGIEWSA